MFLRRQLGASVNLSKMWLGWKCLGIYESVYSSCMSKRWIGGNSHLNPYLCSSGRTEAPFGSWAQANLHLELQKEKSAVLGTGMDSFPSLHCKLKQKWSSNFVIFLSWQIFTIGNNGSEASRPSGLPSFSPWSLNNNAVKRELLWELVFFLLGMMCTADLKSVSVHFLV